MARFTKEDAKAMSILDVAQSLGMEMKQNSSQEWYWVEHDSFKINTRKNCFNWYSRDIQGDVINLVETIKEVDYKQAMHYLRTGEFPKVELNQQPKEPFRYVLGRFEQPFIEARDYLKEVRGLSDDTINFFGQAGVLAQANKKAPDDYLEPVVVFKSLDNDKQVIGASLQGIVPNKERYEGKGYLKQIAYNSDGLSGMSVDIGTPKRLVFAEAPIDLMSYYEANKDNLNDVRLVAMDGLKAGTVSRYTMELLAELQSKSDYKPDLNKVGEALEKLAKVTTFFQDGKNSDLITLAVDNDKAGRGFIERLQEKGIPVQTDIPPLPEGATKMDWNDHLKSQKAGMVLGDSLPRDNSRLAQAERKLERLNGELVEKADRVYAHTRQANGQPMNDKRGGASFFRKQDQLEGAVFTKLDEIKKQEERVEKLHYQQDLKERGFNKQGSGLVMSVDNIPRINEKEQSMELEHEPRFELEFSELGRLEQPLTNFDELQTWMLQQFNSVFVGEGYFKTYLQVYSLDEQGQEVASQIRFDVGHGQSDFNPRREHIRDYLVDNGYIHLQAPKQSQEQIEVIFHSSDEPLLSRYSSGEIIPYTEFVSILYPKNAKLFNENPRTGPTVSLSNDGGTWFGLRTADGQMLVERFRYDVGLEGESISDRLNRILSPAHLEQIRQIDTNFDIPSYVEDKNKELGIEVKLYRDKEHIDTLDFNDLINHPNIEEMANELGHTSLSSYPEEFTIEILDKRLNQSQLTALLDQIIELGKEKDELKQFLTEQLTSLSQSTRPDIFRALTENERTHISEFFKTLIPNVTTSYEFTEEGVEYLSYRIRNMEFASSHPELRELSPEEQYQSLLKFFDKHYGKPFPLPSDQTVMGIELLQEKFGYNPKLPLAVYRDSAQNMDRIAEKEEEAFRSTFDKTMFAKSLELVQKYSLQEVMEGIDIWSGGDEARLEALNSDLRDISLQPLKDFVERYIDPSLYLSHGFEDSPLASLSFQDLADLSHEKGLLDVNGKLVNQKDHMEKEKAPEQAQEHLIDRTSIGTDSLQLEAEGSVKPVSNDTFEQTVTSHPTSSYPLLHFSTNFSEIQRRIGNYHPITEADIKRLNQYAPSIQNTAQWYSNELAGSFVYFVYASQGQQEVLSVNFRKENFVHLTGIRPFEEGKGAADFLDDFVSGRGHYDSILVSNSLKHKLQALPMLSDILDPKSFILDNLTSVEKLHKLDMSEALKSKDEDFLLLFKDAGEERIPASLMKIKGDLKTKVAAVDEKVILGIYRERSGIIDQLSINKEYVKDGGKEFLTILQERQLEPIKAVVKEESLEEKNVAASTDIQPTPAADVSLQSLLESNDSQALFNHLKEGMKEYVNSDKYKQFLQAISKFHDYSIYNVHMMLSQKPDISLVASYRKWKTDFDRQVQKGEKGIKIWVPMTFKEKDKNGQPVLDADGQEKTITRFKLGTVFDVSQTAGKELPKPVYNLESDVPDYQNIYRAARHVSQENGVKISFRTIDSGANGYYHIENNEIVIADKKMSEAQILKTLFHEMAHSELHHHNDGYSRSERELQAESIAYVVANHFGIDTSEYSFAYLHNWSLDKQGYEDLENQLKVVQAESKSLINRIDKSLELVKNKSLTTNKLQSKIAQAKQKQEQEKQLKSSEVKQEKSKKQQPTPKEL
ncbi:PBECR4 domain-containing protein [Streptococcus suis]|uniref:PBECR4 domain-containing protein n=1 Tax=Streptococcus suis TaxID=1307 RepID=UPI00209C1E26|nr:PBECR4 domain-containing protein [Streptococcus suis]MCO8204746.1 PBECR4 domain-containing protein [Streptococcus suis]